MKQLSSSRSHESKLWSTNEQSASSGLSLPTTSASGHATAVPTSADPQIQDWALHPSTDASLTIDPLHRRCSPLLDD